jgi:tetratricopeptide (TPR) repeat protein
MAFEDQAERLKDALEKLTESLGLSSTNQLWSKASIGNKQDWNDRITPGKKIRTNKIQLDKLLQGLRDSGYSISLEQVQELYASISGTELAAESISPVPPGKPTPFLGRSKSVDEIKQLALRIMKEPFSSNILGILGMGGIGKTAIAKYVANDLYDNKIVQAVFWTEITPKLMLTRLLDKWAYYADPNFKYNGEFTNELALQVKGLLEKKFDAKSPVLIVLNDVWDQNEEKIRKLLVACPSNAVILITTRSERVCNTLGVQVYHLNILPIRESIDVLNSYLESQMDEKLLERLAIALGGHTMALELAAKRLNNYADKDEALSKQTREYENGLPAGTGVLKLKSSRKELRENSLRIVLHYSYNDLDDEERKRFRALGGLAFGESFNEVLLKAIWGIESEENAEEYINDLRLLSLVEIEDTTENLRGMQYRQHQIVQSFAVHLLKADEEEYNEVCHQYKSCIINLTEKFAQLPPEKWIELYLYLPHIYQIGNELATLINTNSSPNQETLHDARKFALGIRHYINYQQRVSLIDWLQMGRKASKELENVESEIAFLNDIGLLSNSGNRKEALNYFEEALHLSQTSMHWDGIAITHLNLEKTYIELGDIQEAKKHHVSALFAKSHTNNSQGLIEILANSSLISFEYGHLEEAFHALTHTLDIWREHGDKANEAANLENLAVIYIRGGNLQEAIKLLQQAVTLYETVDKHIEAALIYVELADAASQDSKNEIAKQYLERSENLLVKVDEHEEKLRCLHGIARIYRRMGEKEEALQYYEQALTLSTKISKQYDKCLILTSLAQMYNEQNISQQALRYMYQALETIDKLSDTTQINCTLLNIGNCYRVIDDKDQATSVADLPTTWLTAKSHFEDTYINMVSKYSSET